MFQKSDDTLTLKNNSVKIELILVFFGMQNPEKTSHQTVINVYTSPVQCSYCTLWKADNSHLIEASTKPC